MSYDTILTHLVMLSDEVRTDSYRRAIEEVVRPGDHVLDFGCGTGVLSIFAERAGATRVYAVDRSKMLAAATRMFADNGCSRVEPISGEGDTVELPGPVDVIVSEWMGNFLFAESMLPPLLVLRDRYLRPGGRMIPERCSLHAALVERPTPSLPLDFLRSRPYGIDFRLVADWPYHEVQAVRFAPEDLLPDTACLADLDLATLPAAPRRVRGTVCCSRAATLHGVAGWFDTVLAPGTGFGTGPHVPATHWQHLYFPFEQPLVVADGDAVEIELGIIPWAKETIAWEWQVHAPSGARIGDNVIHQAWLSQHAPKRPPATER